MRDQRQIRVRALTCATGARHRRKRGPPRGNDETPISKDRERWRRDRTRDELTWSLRGQRRDREKGGDKKRGSGNSR
jgi:hypothetical protein